MKMLDVICAALTQSCHIFVKLPDAKTSIIGGDGIHCFRRLDTNTITIHPRLHDGTPAIYICPDDVQLVVLDANHKMLHAQVRLDIASDGNIRLQYTLGDCDQFAPTAELRVCVRVCGVALVNVCVRAAMFNGRTAGSPCGQHAQHVFTNTYMTYMAINPAGTHLVAILQSETGGVVKIGIGVFELPEMKMVTTLASHGGSALCFTDAGTLLVVDYGNASVHHLTLEGLDISSYKTRWPKHVASRGDVFAVATGDGMRVCSLEHRTVLCAWLDNPTWSAVAIIFTDEKTLAVYYYYERMVRLYTLDGSLVKQLNATSGIISSGLAFCADDCLLVSDFNRKCVRVFALDDTELAPFAVHAFQLHPLSYPNSIALRGEYAYVLETMGMTKSIIHVFK